MILIVPGYVLFEAFVRAGQWQSLPQESEEHDTAMRLHPPVFVQTDHLPS